MGGRGTVRDLFPPRPGFFSHQAGLLDASRLFELEAIAA